MTDFLEAAADRIPTLAGVKFTHENLMDYGCARGVRDGKYEILFGRDEMLLASLALGARGAVGSTYNYAGRLYNEVIRRFDAGDLAGAREQQLRAMRFIMTFLRYGDGINAGKAIMRMCGVDCGPVRLPHADLSPEAYMKLEAELRQQGFFDFTVNAGDQK
jgi:N-acetylneuraminate lyase